METEPLTANEYPRLELIGPDDEKPAVYVIPMGKSVIGRHPDCELQIDSIFLSRKHASLHRREDGVDFFDDKSRSATYVNGERICVNAWHRLMHGDRLRFSGVACRYLEHATYWDD